MIWQHRIPWMGNGEDVQAELTPLWSVVQAGVRER